MTKIIVINGFPRSGKDTFCNLCQKNKRKNLKVFSYSTIDYIKTVATFCGWNGEKDSKSRKMLSELKKVLTNWNDSPYNIIKRRIRAVEHGYPDEDKIIFIHCREPDEISRFVEDMNAITIFIDRNMHDSISNSSDANVLDYYYDYIIDNNGSLEQLKDSANFFIEEIFKNN